MNKKRWLFIIALVAFGFTGRGFAAFSSVNTTTTTCEVAFIPKSVPVDPVTLEANYLLKCQVKNNAYGADDLGCFNDVEFSAGPTWVVPRENGTAMLGLIEAYMLTGEEEYKIAALRCAEYLRRRQEAEGFWCNHYDESNAAAAYDVRVDSNPSVSQTGSVIMALFKVMKTGWDGSSLYYETAKKGAQYIIAAIDNKPGARNGLSGSGKEYGSDTGQFTLDDAFGHYRWGGWSWMSDNCYSYQALMDMKEWAAARGEYEFAAQCYEHALGVLNGIDTVMKDPYSSVWYRVVNQDGGPAVAGSENFTDMVDAMCYYPQKMDLPVANYGSAGIATWMIDNLQVNSGIVPNGLGAFVWRDADPNPSGGTRLARSDRRSQGFSMEAWLALNDIAGPASETARYLAKTWWESQDNTGGRIISGTRTQLWDVVNGGITDWYDPDGSPDGYVEPDDFRFIDTSAYAIFVYNGGYNFKQANEDPIAAKSVGTGGGSLNLEQVDGSRAVTLNIPAGALESTRTITVQQLPANSVPQISGASVVAAYEFLPSGLTFRVPVTLSLFYADADHDGIVDGTQQRAADLRIFVLDGTTWQLVGGTVDAANNRVTWEISHFSIYALFHVGALTEDDYRTKDRIITPLTPGYDKARFPMLSSGDVINIYDVTGRRVRQISQAPYDWDGRDDDNDVVESGIYVYQVKAAGKTVSGTIVVAK